MRKDNELLKEIKRLQHEEQLRAVERRKNASRLVQWWEKRERLIQSNINIVKFPSGHEQRTKGRQLTPPSAA